MALHLACVIISLVFLFLQPIATSGDVHNARLEARLEGLRFAIVSLDEKLEKMGIAVLIEDVKARSERARRFDVPGVNEVINTLASTLDKVVAQVDKVESDISKLMDTVENDISKTLHDAWFEIKKIAKYPEELMGNLVDQMENYALNLWRDVRVGVILVGAVVAAWYCFGKEMLFWFCKSSSEAVCCWLFRPCCEGETTPAMVLTKVEELKEELEGLQAQLDVSPLFRALQDIATVVQILDEGIMHDDGSEPGVQMQLATPEAELPIKVDVEFSPNCTIHS